MIVASRSVHVRILLLRHILCCFKSGVDCKCFSGPVQPVAIGQLPECRNPRVSGRNWRDSSQDLPGTNSFLDRLTHGILIVFAA